MDLIKQVIEAISANIYLQFVCILIATVLIAFVFKFILKKVLKPFIKKTKTQIDDLIVKSISSMSYYIVLIVGVKYALKVFEFKTPFYDSLINSVLILVVSVILVKIINNFSKQWIKEWKFRTKTSADERLIPFLKKILKSLVIVLAAFFIFDSWNIDISPLLATAGVAGLAIGLAVKDSLSNILGGLQLVLDQTFKVEDKVMLESGELGVIMDIGLRSTKLRTYDNETIYIPNGYLANSKIKNYTKPDLTIRVNVEFGVTYGTKIEEVKKVVVDAVREIDKVLEKPEPVVQFLKMSDFSLDFVARGWVEDYIDAWGTWLEMNEKIYDALNKAHISIPFPTRTVYSKKID